MYARLSLLPLGPGTRAQAEQLADRHAALWRQQPGFRTIVFVGDDARGEYGNFSVWDTREQAETAAAMIWQQLPELMRELGLQVQGPLAPRIFEVYEPKVVGSLATAS